MNRIPKAILRSAGMAAIPLAACLLSSCAVVAWTVATFAPPQKVKPVYVPPRDKRVLVFVDDLRSPVADGTVKRELTERINQGLTEHGVAGQTIPYENLLRLMTQDTRFNEFRVGAVGQRLGADLVLYVEITSFRLKDSPDSPTWDARLGTSVRWVDPMAVADKARLWPTERLGDAGYEMPVVGLPAKDEATVSGGQEVTLKLAERMADRIVKLFHEYEVPAMGERE